MAAGKLTSRFGDGNSSVGGSWDRGPFGAATSGFSPGPRCCCFRRHHTCMYCPVAVCMYVLLGCCMHVCIARLLYACTCMFCSVSIGLFALFGYCRQCMCHLCVSVSYHQLNKRGSVITYSPHRKVQSPEVLSVKVQSLEIKVLIRKVVQRDPS